MRHRQAVRQGTLTPPSQVRLLLAQLKTPHGGFRASVRGFCCLDGKSMPGRQNPSRGLVSLSAARGVLRPCPAAKSRPPGFVRPRPAGLPTTPPVAQRLAAAPSRLWAGFRAAPTALAFPVGLERPRRASNSPRAPVRSCGTCKQDGPLGFPAGLIAGFYPKPVEVVSLFAKGGVCRYRRTASFASL